MHQLIDTLMEYQSQIPQAILPTPLNLGSYEPVICLVAQKVLDHSPIHYNQMLVLSTELLDFLYQPIVLS